MKGTSLTEAQLDRAREFVHGRSTNHNKTRDTEIVAIPFAQIVRMVAWYGAIRYEAGAKGIGTLDAPGETGVKP